MRINRFLAGAGLGSRRGVERLVLDGRVRVNGEVVRDLGRQVDPDADSVEVEGRRVVLERRIEVLALHKPVGVVSSLRRQGDARCLLDLLDRDLPRLFHVGRLDRDSSGLLLLTNDGDLANGLLHPRRPVWKVYEVETAPAVDPGTIEDWRAGTTELDGRKLAPVRVHGLDASGRRLRMELREGRNRQIRRMVEAAGGRVERLHRVAFGPVVLGGLAPGRTRALSAEELRAVREVAGIPTEIDDPDPGA